MSSKEPPAKTPDGEARFFKTRQMEANEKGFVGFETVWEPFQKRSKIRNAQTAVGSSPKSMCLDNTLVNRLSSPKESS